MSDCLPLRNDLRTWAKEARVGTGLGSSPKKEILCALWEKHGSPDIPGAAKKKIVKQLKQPKETKLSAKDKNLANSRVNMRNMNPRNAGIRPAKVMKKQNSEKMINSNETNQDENTQMLGLESAETMDEKTEIFRLLKTKNLARSELDLLAKPFYDIMKNIKTGKETPAYDAFERVAQILSNSTANFDELHFDIAIVKASNSKMSWPHELAKMMNELKNSWKTWVVAYQAHRRAANFREGKKETSG
jgi:hypothetical protein